MKKYIIIGLIVLVGGAMLLKPFFKDEVIDVPTKVSPAKFTFKDNLAAIYNQPIPLEIEVNEEVQKIEIIFNDSTIHFWDNPKGKLTFMFDPSSFGVGTKSLHLLTTLQDGTTFIDNRLVRVLSEVIPEKYSVKIVNTYPHNPTSFTQGLEFYEGKLYEGTGDPGNLGKTLVAQVDLKTGNHVQKMGLQAGYFGEGITILNDTLYQITWQNNKCYTYNVKSDLQLAKEFSYTGEGWGLCNDGTSIIMSNGSERIVFRNPSTFEIERTIEVFSNEGPVGFLNELEYINGKIFANVWTTNSIVSIDPKTGKVMQEIDATDLVKIGKGMGEVLNGIALDKTTGKLFLTGKNWDRMYEVLFVEPGM